MVRESSEINLNLDSRKWRTFRLGWISCATIQNLVFDEGALWSFHFYAVLQWCERLWAVERSRSSDCKVV
jgi:hypothetical protein